MPASIEIAGKVWPLSMSVGAMRRIGLAHGVKGVNLKKIVEALDSDDFSSVALFAHSMIPTKPEPWEQLSSRPFEPAPSLEDVEESINTQNVRAALKAIMFAISGEVAEEDADGTGDAEPGPPMAPSP